MEALACPTLFAEIVRGGTASDIALRRPQGLIQNDTPMCSSETALRGPYQSTQKEPSSVVTGTRCSWDGQLVSIQGKTHTSCVHPFECQANRIRPLSGFVFCHPPCALPLGYNEPPGKQFLCGLLPATE